MYKVTFTKLASKYLYRLPLPDMERILSKIELLAEDRDDTLDIKKLQWYELHTFRLRVGPYRVIYRKFDTELLIDIIKIGSRGDVYND
jgi:mRNA interferase RelE/StbE